MPTVMNMNEAKANFSGLLSFVCKDRATVTIMRYGHPVAQIVPIERHNRTKTDPLLSRIVIKGDPCENDADDWEDA